MSVNDKRAALEMHALGPQDREWILGRLAADERRRVERMLGELDTMNIRFDLEPDSLATGPDPRAGAAAPVSATTRPALAAVRDADPDTMLQVLAGEPPWLVRALLAVEAWPWLERVRAGLAGRHTPAMQPRRNPAVAVQPPAALAAALVDLVGQRLLAREAAPRMNGHANGHARLNEGAHGWGRLWSGVKRWLP